MPDVCKHCNVEITLDNMRTTGYIKKNGDPLYSKTECNSCACRRARDSRRLRKQNPPPPAGSPCECCGRGARQLVLDHDHRTGAFRGYICQSCNMALGHFGDTLDGLLQAAGYLMVNEPTYARDPAAESPEALCRAGLAGGPGSLDGGAEGWD